MVSCLQMMFATLLTFTVFYFFIFTRESYSWIKMTLYNVNSTEKTILLWTGFFSERIWFGEKTTKGLFTKYNCPISNCVLSVNKEDVTSSSLVLFHGRNLWPWTELPSFRDPKQSWIYMINESPIFTYYMNNPKFRHAFNLSMTYRIDADIVAGYGSYVPINTTTQRLSKHKTQKKDKLILWFISNCDAKARYRYYMELKEYINIDMYGECGEPDPCGNKRDCVSTLQSQYKFYLAFENSKCDYYITEKFWKSLIHGMVPIALGARMSDYEEVAPPNSFLHVDNFTSPKELAIYLHYLDKNDKAYYKYHEWRKFYKIGGGNHILCDLCARANANVTEHKTLDLDEIWNKQKHCSTDPESVYNPLLSALSININSL